MSGLALNVAVGDGTAPPSRPDKAFWAMCPACRHCWPAAFLPMEVEAAARLMIAARCPKGCDSRPVVPKQSDGALLEEQTTA